MPKPGWLKSNYQTAKTHVGNFLSNPRVQGGLQACVGLSEMFAGGAATYGTFGLAAPLGWLAVGHGADQFVAGMRSIFNNRHELTATEHLLHKTGMSQGTASLINNALSFTVPTTAFSIARSARYGEQTVALYNPAVAPAEGWVLPAKGGGSWINGRWYTEHALERMAPRTPEVMATLEVRSLARARAQGILPTTEEYGRWLVRGKGPGPRGIPPLVVEAEITHPGTTSIRVCLNETGDVITVIPGGT